MTPAGGFDYIRRVDVDRLERTDPTERYAQDLFDAASGARHCAIAYIRTPPGGGSPAGLHVHDVDQIFYVVSGTMTLEIQGERYTEGPGSLIVFPAGVPHRNWNAASEPLVHIAFNVPLPDPTKTFAIPVDEAPATGGPETA